MYFHMCILPILNLNFFTRFVNLMYQNYINLIKIKKKIKKYVMVLDLVVFLLVGFSTPQEDFEHSHCKLLE